MASPANSSKSEALSLAGLAGDSVASEAPLDLSGLKGLLLPPAGGVSVRLSKRVHRKLSLAAHKSGKSRGSLADAAIERAIDKMYPGLDELVAQVWGETDSAAPKGSRAKSKGGAA